MLKRVLKFLAALLALLVLAVAAMYVSSTPKFAVPATVMDDARLPAITIGGVRLHAEAFGPEGAPVVVVLHGGPGNDYRYLLALKALADHYRVVFYDQRGTGLSQRVPASALGIDDYVNELAGVVDHYSPERPVLLVGHSWGAMLATAYIARHPQRVRAAVLAEPGFLTSELGNELYAKTNHMMPPVTAGLIWYGTRTWFESLHVAGPDAAAARDYLMQRIVSKTDVEGYPTARYFCGGKAKPFPLWRLGGTAMLATQQIADDQGKIHIDFTSGLERFDGPVLFLSGSCNTLIGPAYQERQMHFFTHARLSVIDGSGHMMFNDKPEESLARVREFLASVK